jgi:hypothetical protein
MHLGLVGLRGLLLTVRGARITWALPDLGQLVSILTVA